MNKFLKTAGSFFTSRGFSSGVITALVIAIVVVVNIVIYTLSSLLGLYVYSPLSHEYGVTDATEPLFREAEEKGEKVTITFLMAKEDIEQHNTGKFVHKTALSFAEKYSFIDIKYINLLTKMDEDNRIVDLSKYQKDLRGDDVELRTHSIIFSHGEGNEENYRVVTDLYSSAGFADFYALDSKGAALAYSGEEVMASMISWVLNEEHKTVYFTENHGETIDVAFSTLLACAGYYIDVINLRTDEVPDDAALVVISNPISDFERAGEGSGVRAELERLDTYLERGNGGEGGRLYVAIDPYSAKMNNLEALLAEYGITLTGKDGEYGYSRDLVLDPSEAIAMDGMSFIASFAEGEKAGSIAGNIKDYSSGRVLLSQVARLSLDGNAEALLLSSPTSSVLWEGETVDDGGKFPVAAYSSRNEAEGATSEIVVIPTALLSNGDIMISDGYSNKDFLYSMLDEVYGANTAVYGTSSVVYDTGIVENLTQSGATLYTCILLAIPFALAVVGAVVVIRRKRR